MCKVELNIIDLKSQVNPIGVPIVEKQVLWSQTASIRNSIVEHQTKKLATNNWWFADEG